MCSVIFDAVCLVVVAENILLWLCCCKFAAVILCIFPFMASQVSVGTLHLLTGLSQFVACYFCFEHLSMLVTSNIIILCECLYVGCQYVCLVAYISGMGVTIASRFYA